MSSISFYNEANSNNALLNSQIFYLHVTPLLSLYWAAKMRKKSHIILWKFLRLNDKADDTLYFSYCQQIPWKANNVLICLSDLPSLSMAFSRHPIGSN